MIEVYEPSKLAYNSNELVKILSEGINNIEKYVKKMEGEEIYSK